jgi:hypothetical protein
MGIEIKRRRVGEAERQTKGTRKKKNHTKEKTRKGGDGGIGRLFTFQLQLYSLEWGNGLGVSRDFAQLSHHNLHRNTTILYSRPFSCFFSLLPTSSLVFPNFRPSLLLP